MEFHELMGLILVTYIVFEGYMYLQEIKRTQARRFWVSPMYMDRDINGFFAISFEYMYEKDPEQFLLAVRMKKELFTALFNLVKEDLTKNSNRPAISAKCRLFLTLVYLAHGGSKQYLSMTFKMGLTTVKRIVKETCNILWNTLSPFYLSIPNKSEWQKIAEDYEKIWNFPHCVGAIDGKHVNISCPPNSGTMFYNYKGTYSIILLGICDANYTFTAIDIGAYGSQSDGGVLWNSAFGKSLFQGKLELPHDRTTGNTDMTLPYFFVGDAAFPLKSFLMRPFPGLLLDEKKEYFNKRLSRARRTIENAFGVLTARWRILRNTLDMNVESAESIVKAAVVLHNFVKMSDSTYCPPEFVDHYNGETIIEGLWRNEVRPLRKASRISSNNASRNAFQIRNNLKDYIFENKI